MKILVVQIWKKKNKTKYFGCFSARLKSFVYLNKTVRFYKCDSPGKKDIVRHSYGQQADFYCEILNSVHL